MVDFGQSYGATSSGRFVTVRERLTKAGAVGLGQPSGLPAPAVRSVGTPMPILAGPMGPQTRGVFGVMSGWINSIAADMWFTPGQPVAPQAPPETQPRALDFPVGINIMYVPRSEEDITFQQLRSLADLWDLLRLCIETRKDQVVAADWNVRPVRDPMESSVDYQERVKTDPTVQEIRDLLMKPNGVDGWRTWIRTFLEEQIVLDAVAVLPGKDNGRKTLEILDGATIKRLIDNRGRTPRPQDGVAYQQIVKGVPAINFTTDDLYYFRRNVRAHKLYGMSPVEQVTWTINLAIRRALYKMSYYTEGNIPEAFIQVPAEWGLDQVRTFSEWFNSLLAGQVDVRRRAFFLPGVQGKDSIIFPKQDVLKDEMDEWLIRIACYCVGVSPEPFIRMMNRATAQTSQEASRAEGLAPVLRWIEECMTALIQGPLEYKDYEFSFAQEMEFDTLKKAQRQALQISRAIKSPDEIREENGDDPIGVGPGIVTATGFVELVPGDLDANAGQPDDPAGAAPDKSPWWDSEQAADAKAKGGNGKPADGNGKPKDGKDGKTEPVQKVSAADAYRSRRAKRRGARTVGHVQRFLDKQRTEIARRAGEALDQRRSARKVWDVDLLDELGIDGRERVPDLD